MGNKVELSAIIDPIPAGNSVELVRRRYERYRDVEVIRAALGAYDFSIYNDHDAHEEGLGFHLAYAPSVVSAQGMFLQPRLIFYPELGQAQFLRGATDGDITVYNVHDVFIEDGRVNMSGKTENGNTLAFSIQSSGKVDIVFDRQQSWQVA